VRYSLVFVAFCARFWTTSFQGFFEIEKCAQCIAVYLLGLRAVLAFGRVVLFLFCETEFVLRAQTRFHTFPVNVGSNIILSASEKWFESRIEHGSKQNMCTFLFTREYW
jgi:hypothetical protein